jgi:hypothetical protein
MAASFERPVPRSIEVDTRTTSIAGFQHRRSRGGQPWGQGPMFEGLRSPASRGDSSAPEGRSLRRSSWVAALPGATGRRDDHERHPTFRARNLRAHKSWHAGQRLNARTRSASPPPCLVAMRGPHSGMRSSARAVPVAHLRQDECCGGVRWRLAPIDDRWLPEQSQDEMTKTPFQDGLQLALIGEDAPAVQADGERTTAPRRDWRRGT